MRMLGAECALAQSVTSIRIGSIALLGSVFIYFTAVLDEAAISPYQIPNFFPTSSLIP